MIVSFDPLKVHLNHLLHLELTVLRSIDESTVFFDEKVQPVSLETMVCEGMTRRIVSREKHECGTDLLQGNAVLTSQSVEDVSFDQIQEGQS